MVIPIDAYILAGEGETHAHYSPLLEAAGVTNKALIELNGIPMVYYMLKALDTAKTIKSITVVGLKENQVEFEFHKPVTFIEGGSTTFDSIISAMDHFAKEGKPDKYVLSCPCDTPLITAEMIDRYLMSVDFNEDKDYYYPLVWKDVLLKRYPHVSKMPLKFRDGHFYGGDLHLFKISTIIDRKDIVHDILMNRKNFFKVARIISLRYIFLYLFNRLTLSLAEDWFKSRFKLNVFIVAFDYPEACADLDYEKDLEEFQRLCALTPRKLDDDEKVHFISKYEKEKSN